MGLTNKKILVTGADGFIGSHLAETLVKLGCDVRAFVYYNSFNSWGWLDCVEGSIRDSLDVFPGDVRDPYRVQTAVKGCDVVFHLAALIAIPYSYQSPHSYVETNVTGTLNILQAAKESGVEKVIHTSTSEVYGTAQYVPIDERHPLQGQSPYSATKIGADAMAESFYRSFDLPVIIARPFNTYGPRQSTRAVIPTIITQIAAGAQKVKLGSLHPTRDFTYIKDIVSAFIAIGEANSVVGEVINIGSNFEISIGDTAKTIASIMGVEIDIQTDEARIRPKGSEVERLWASNEKARRLLNWTPKYAGFDGFKRGLKKTADWFANKENLALYKSEIYNL